MKTEGGDNDLVARIMNDDYFKVVHDKIDQILDPKSFIGRAPEQVLILAERNVMGIIQILWFVHKTSLYRSQSL